MFKELDPTNDLTFLRIRTKVKKMEKKYIFKSFKVITFSRSTR